MFGTHADEVELTLTTAPVAGGGSAGGWVGQRPAVAKAVTAAVGGEGTCRAHPLSITDLPAMLRRRRRGGQ